MGEKFEIMRAKNPGCSRKQVGDKHNWETTGKRVRNHAAQSTQSVLGDKRETSLKLHGQRIQSVVGD